MKSETNEVKIEIEIEMKLIWNSFADLFLLETKHCGFRFENGNFDFIGIAIQKRNWKSDLGIEIEIGIEFFRLCEIVVEIWSYMKVEVSFLGFKIINNNN